MKFKITNKGLYWGLIVTFGLLYVLVAFVSTLHAIDFFRLSNIGGLAILLGIAYEVGQASVLFSILMTKNKEKFLPWVLMFLLTALQVTANVYASFKHMSIDGTNDWTYWYTSILKIFGVTGGSTETYQVIISWISGALLPIVALGMTALVAQNIKLITEEGVLEETPLPEGTVDASDLIAEVSKVRPTEDDLEEAEAILGKKKPSGYYEEEGPFEDPKGHEPSTPKEQEEIDKIKKLMTQDPVESGAISDDLKKIISPGIEPDGKDDGTSKKPIPTFVSPGVSIRETGNTPKEEDFGERAPTTEVLPPTEDVKDELKDEEVVAQIPTENEPQPTENEPQDMGEVMSDLTERDTSPPPELDIKHNNGLVDIETLPVDRSEERDMEPPLDDNPVNKEEERLEHLRNVARENLKKK